MMTRIPCTAKTLAAALVLSERRISELTRVKVFHKPYDLLVAVPAYVKFLRSEPGDLTEERARLTKAQADLMELRVRTRTGELVERAAVTAEAFIVGRRIRDGVENLPARLSGLFAAESDQAAIFELFSKEIHLCLEGLANAKPGRA